MTHNDEEEDLRRALELSLQDYITHQNSNTSTNGPAEQVAATGPAPSVGLGNNIPVAPGGKEDTQTGTPGSGSPKAKRSRIVTEPYHLSEGERSRIFKHIFGKSPLRDDLERWHGSYFSYSDHVRFGLWQKQGGPCGVLVPLQGLILRILLFPKNEQEGERLPCPPKDITEERRWRALLLALIIILTRTTADGVYYFVTSDKDALLVHTFGSGRDIMKFLEDSGKSVLSTPGAIVNFIFSLILTRSLEKILSDTDDDQQPLIGRFGHCSQELVNLMLFGRATSNVFDGVQEIENVMKLQGVTVPQVDIGYLSEVEAMRYVTVGERLKFPRYPIWVIGSQTHYTLLFCKDPDVAEAGNNSKERQIRDVFNRHCIDIEAGMADFRNLDIILNELQITDKDRIRSTLQELGSDVFLWSDFWEIVGGGNDIQSQGIKRFDMYLYDGQDPPGPQLRHFTLETCDLEAAFGQGDSDNFIAALRTRWQMCLISDLQLI